MRFRKHILSLAGCALLAALFGLQGCGRSDPSGKPERPFGLRATLDGHSRVSRVAFSPNGRTLAVGCEQDPARVWDLETGKELFRLASVTNVKALVFNPAGRTLATACQEPVIRFWDAKTGEEKTAFRDDIGKVTLLAYSPDGGTLASWSEQDFWSAQILLWDVASGKQKTPLKLELGFTHSMIFSPDGKTLAVSRSDPNGVDFWDLATRQRKFVPVGPADRGLGEGWVGEAYFCSDGRRMAFFQEEPMVRLWDLDRQRQHAEFKVAGLAKYPTAAPRSDGKLAAIGQADGLLTLWNPDTGKMVNVQASRMHVPYGHFSPDGRTLATHEILESEVKIWDVPTLLEKGK